MLLNGVSTSLAEKEEHFINKLQDAIIENGSNLAWVSRQITREIISLSTYIQSDVFGAYSDFEDLYPHATLLTKAYILKNFIDIETNNKAIYNENHISYPVNTITETLQTYISNSERFDRALEEQLLRNVLRENPDSHRITLSNTNRVFSELCHIAIFKAMQDFLNNSEQKDDELQAWLNAKKENLYQKNLNFERPPASFREDISSYNRYYFRITYNITPLQTAVLTIYPYSLIFGYTNFRSFYEHESHNLRKLMAIISNIFSRTRYENVNMGFINILSFLNSSMINGIEVVLRFYRMAILTPVRLLQVITTESTRSASIFLKKLLSFFINPEGRIANNIINSFSFAANIASLILCYYCLNVSFTHLSNLEFIPNYMNFSFFFSIPYSVYGALDLGSLMINKSINLFRNFMPFIRSLFQGKNKAKTLENELSQEIDAKIQITLEQRRALIRLLMAQKETQSLDNKAIINQELSWLSNIDRAYYLSDLDMTIIQNQNRGAEFNLSAGYIQDELNQPSSIEIEEDIFYERRQIIPAATNHCAQRVVNTGFTESEIEVTSNPEESPPLTPSPHLH